MALRYGMLPSGDEPFVVTGMFTASHKAAAERLVASLRSFSLPHAIFEVPTVHRSISHKGSDELAYTKSNFIWHVIQSAGRPVLYVDVDCVVRKHPELIRDLASGGHDFAILNWLAQDRTDGYIPIPLPPAPGTQPHKPRFFRFSHQISFVAKDQLICSGGVQFWGRSPAATSLLSAWYATIVAQPGVADDQCLDFAFNNKVAELHGSLNPFWLPKNYLRLAWWIFEEPVIDHPEFPGADIGWATLRDPSGRLRFYPERATVRSTPPRVPPGCAVDTQTGNILKSDEGRLTCVGRVPEKIWLPA